MSKYLLSVKDTTRASKYGALLFQQIDPPAAPGSPLPPTDPVRRPD